MVHYVWQARNWPEFNWNSEALLVPLGKTRQSQGRILGEAEYIGLEMQAAVLTEEAFTTTAIEGEKLDISDLVEKGIIVRNPAGGRSVNYDLVWP